MTTKTKTIRPDVRLHCAFTDSTGNRYGGSLYAHFEARVVILSPERWGEDKGRIRPHDPDSYEVENPGPDRELTGFRVTAQIDDHTPEFYGFHVGFEPEHAGLADLDQAKRFVRVLTRVERKREALTAEYGYPRNIVQLMTYVASALGLSGQPFTRALGDQPDIEGSGVRSMNADSLRWWLADQVKAWRVRYGLTVSEDA